MGSAERITSLGRLLKEPAANPSCSDSTICVCGVGQSEICQQSVPCLDRFLHNFVEAVNGVIVVVNHVARNHHLRRTVSDEFRDPTSTDRHRSSGRVEGIRSTVQTSTLPEERYVEVPLRMSYDVRETAELSCQQFSYGKEESRPYGTSTEARAGILDWEIRGKNDTDSCVDVCDCFEFNLQVKPYQATSSLSI